MGLGGAGQSNGVSLDVPEGLAITCFAKANAAVPATFTVTARYHNTKTVAVVIGIGGWVNFPSTLFESVDLPSSGGLFSVISDNEAFQISPGVGVIQQPQGPTVVTDEQNILASIAAATVETVEVAGVTALPSGTRVQGILTMQGPLTTAADVLTYVALKGATSGIYYAIAFAGQIMFVDFYIMQTTAEKLNIVARNQDTAAHEFHSHWAGVNP